MKSIVVLTLFSVLMIGNMSSSAAETWLEDYAGDVQARAHRSNVPGYAFVFVEKNQPAKVMFYGKTERRGVAIDQDTVFRLASVSKTFAGILMAKMVEQQQLSWQTPLLDIAPQYGFNRLDPNPIRLNHLLGQSSGYMPNSYDNLIEANYSVKRVLSSLAKLEPLCKPGKCYTYQNALFGVLEDYYINQQSSYSQVLKQQIIEPLGMPNASTGKQALLKSDKWAKPHIAIARDRWRKTQVQDDYYHYGPAAGVNASIMDMTIWLRAMLGEYPQVVSPQIIETVTTPQIKTSRDLQRRDWRKFLKDAHYGLGWRVYNFQGHKLNYHGGWVQGYRADVAFAPEQQVGFAMLMNAESNLINSFTAQFWERYFEQLEAVNLQALSKKMPEHTPE